MRIKTGWVLLLLLLAPLLKAQPPESLIIQPGDLLHVMVFNTPELEEHVRVTDSGDLRLVLGGTIKVSGLTVAAASRAVEDLLLRQHILNHPQVLITVDEYSTQKVTVIGEVRNPGALVVSTSRSVLDVIGLAGGLTDMADRNITIQRYGSTEKLHYFLSNDPKVAFDSQVMINPGDTLMVPKAEMVYMLGDVKTPGGYTMTNNHGQLSALQLLARAGGTPPTAVPGRARLIRKTENGYTETPLQLSDMQKGKRPDIAMQPDDIIYVPFSYLKNFVYNSSGIVASAATAAIYKY